MDEDQGDWLATYFSAGDDAPAVDEAATAAAAPEGDAPPVANDGTDEPLTDASAEPEVESVDAEPVETGPAPLDWNHPELAALKAQAEQDRVEAEQNRAIKAQLAQLQRQKAATQFQSHVAELADGDPERLQQINGVIAQVVTPAVQNWQAAEQQATVTAKALSAMWIAAQATLSDEQVSLLKAETDALMAVEGPEVMQRTAFGKRDFQRQQHAAITERDKRIAELELQVASQGQLAQRERSGADLVDGGGGGFADGGTREDRMRGAQSMDDYWSAMTGRTA
jgi:hypothetical protein